MPDNLDDEALQGEAARHPAAPPVAAGSALGDSRPPRAGPGQNEDELVLVIRGELLKRYPTAVIYAHRACWQRKTATAPPTTAKRRAIRSGAIDNTVERRLAPLTAPEEATAAPHEGAHAALRGEGRSRHLLLRLRPHGRPKAKGGTGENPATIPAGSSSSRSGRASRASVSTPRRQPKLQVWNDLSWPDVQPGAPGSHIELATAPAAFSSPARAAQTRRRRRSILDDKKVAWSRDMSSAELAYILFQAPVLVAVHASEMLPKE